MKSMSSREVISVLTKQGWIVLKGRGKGSHTRLELPDGSKSTTVPRAKDQPPKTLKSIEDQTGIKF